MRFVMPDGHQVQGRSYTDVVQAMSRSKFDEPRTLRSYRRATAQRAAEAYQVKISWEDDRSFVLDLVKTGLLKKLS